MFYFSSISPKAPDFSLFRRKMVMKECYDQAEISAGCDYFGVNVNEVALPVRLC